MDDKVICTSSPEAAAMSDDEFWELLEARRHNMTPEQLREHEHDLTEFEFVNTAQFDPCPECGVLGACGYDAEGRPMIHTTTEDGAI